MKKSYFEKIYGHEDHEQSADMDDSRYKSGKETFIFNFFT